MLRFQRLLSEDGGWITLYGWRSRIGLVKATHRGKTFAFWFETAPDGVEIVPTFIGFRSGHEEGFLGAFERIEQLAVQLRDVHCDVIVIGGTPPFLLKGLEFERAWRDDLSRKIGLPVVTPMEPHAIALKSMGVRRVASATYFGDRLNQAIVDYFAAFGMETLIIPGFRRDTRSEGLYTTPLMALDEVSHMEVYRHCKRGLANLGSRVDALYINGGGWDAAPVLQVLEQDMGIRVVWAQAADVWYTYHKLGIHNPVQGYGSLLEEFCVPVM